MEWKIKQGGEDCNRCERLFTEGEVYFSTIQLEEGLLQREDFCEDCFDRSGLKEEGSFWRTRKTRVKEVKKTVNFEMLRELYFKMLTMPDKEIKELAYLIGLILVRKRFLRLKSFVSEEGGDFMLIQQKKDAPVKKMEVPLLAEEDIVTLRDRLSDLLDADLASMLDMDELRDKLAAPPAAETAADQNQPDEGRPEETQPNATQPAETRPDEPQSDAGLPDGGLPDAIPPMVISPKETLSEEAMAEDPASEKA